MQDFLKFYMIITFIEIYTFIPGFLNLTDVEGHGRVKEIVKVTFLMFCFVITWNYNLEKISGMQTFWYMFCDSEWCLCFFNKCLFWWVLSLSLEMPKLSSFLSFKFESHLKRNEVRNCRQTSMTLNHIPGGKHQSRQIWFGRKSHWLTFLEPHKHSLWIMCTCIYVCINKALEEGASQKFGITELTCCFIFRLLNTHKLSIYIYIYYSIHLLFYLDGILATGLQCSFFGLVIFRELLQMTNQISWVKSKKRLTSWKESWFETLVRQTGFSPPPPPPPPFHIYIHSTT